MTRNDERLAFLSGSWFLVGITLALAWVWR